jgi:hypothetical protein
MFKRFGALALILAGGMAVFTPAVAQARDRDDYQRVERRDDRRDHERREQREYRSYHYDRTGRYCPR